MASDVEHLYPWPETGRWLRAVMVMAPDGATVGKDGRSRSLSGRADQQVLHAIRTFSDAILIGAGTFRAERYGPPKVAEKFIAERRSSGLSPAPRLVIVSGTLDLPWDEPVFQEGPETPIVVTKSDQPESVLAAAAGCEVLQSPGDGLDMKWMVTELAARGLNRIACEGGSRLLNSLAESGCVDEWDVSISPHLPSGSVKLADSRVDDGFVFTRFVRSGPND